jgi:hypothetical protein
MINEVIQIRTEYALQKLKTSNLPSQQVGFIHQSYILDIDVDFWDGKENYESDFEIIRSLIPHAKLVTIATSPYFMDQKKAIEIIKAILQ